MKQILFLFSLLSIGATSIAQNGLNFDGSNDFVQTTYPGVLNASNRTFEAWINVSPNAPNSNLAILDYGVNQPGARNTFQVAGDRSLRFISGGTNANLASAPGDVPVGQWTHVAFVMNNGTGFLYVNGNQVDTGSLSSVNTPFGNTNVRIGQRVAGGSILFNGTIDEVRIWNVARGVNELGLSRNVEYCSIPTGLVAYYKLNEGTAGGNNTGITMVQDAASGNNGTLNFFALTGGSSNFVPGINLTTSVAASQVLSVCQGTPVQVGGNSYDSTGIYVDTLATVLTGCDSIVTTDLTVVGSSTFTQTLNECPGFSLTVDSNTYSVSGIYVDTLTSMVTGCDSIVTTDLTIDTLDVSTSVAFDTLTATQVGVTYAWINCDSGNTTIAGATNQSFVPIQNGNYAVVLDDGTCQDTSDCVQMIVVGIDGPVSNAIKLFPVPVSNKLTIQWDGSDHFSIAILNSTGQLLMRTISDGNVRQLDVSSFPAGIYFVEVEKEGRVFRRRFARH